MLAVYKKEMKSYFISMFGYAFIAFMLVIVSFCVYMTNVRGASPFIGYAFNTPYIPIIFMILVPMLTMKIFADERATKTDQILFTAPIKVSDIVWGKFLAVATVYTIPVLVIAVYPLVLQQYGDVPIANSYVAILGFWLMGMAYFSIGVYVSSITENQVISAVATFAVLFVSFIAQYVADVLPNTAIAGLVGWIIFVLVIAIVYAIAAKGVKRTSTVAIVIASVGIIVAVVLYFVNGDIFQNSLQKLLYTFSLDYNLQYFIGDFLDIPTIIYYVSVVCIAMYLTMQSINKKRG